MPVKTQQGMKDKPMLGLPPALRFALGTTAEPKYRRVCGLVAEAAPGATISHDLVHPVKSASSNWFAARPSTRQAEKLSAVPSAKRRASASLAGRAASNCRMNRSSLNKRVV